MDFYRENFNTIQKKSRLSTNIIAEQIGVSVSSLWSWKNGRRKPKERNVRRLAEILNVSVTEISDLSELPHSYLKKTDLISKQSSNLLSFSAGRGEELLAMQKAAFAKALEISAEFNNTASLVRTFMESLGMIFYIKDIGQKYIIVNKLFLKNVRLPENINVTGKQDSDFFTHNDAVDNTKEDQQVLDTKIPVFHRDGYLYGSRKKGLTDTQSFLYIIHMDKYQGSLE